MCFKPKPNLINLTPCCIRVINSFRNFQSVHNTIHITLLSFPSVFTSVPLLFRNGSTCYRYLDLSLMTVASSVFSLVVGNLINFDSYVRFIFEFNVLITILQTYLIIRLCSSPCSPVSESKGLSLQRPLLFLPATKKPR